MFWKALSHQSYFFVWYWLKNIIFRLARLEQRRDQPPASLHTSIEIPDFRQLEKGDNWIIFVSKQNKLICKMFFYSTLQNWTFSQERSWRTWIGTRSCTRGGRRCSATCAAGPSQSPPSSRHMSRHIRYTATLFQAHVKAHQVNSQPLPGTSGIYYTASLFQAHVKEYQVPRPLQYIYTVSNLCNSTYNATVSNISYLSPGPPQYCTCRVVHSQLFLYIRTQPASDVHMLRYIRYIQ